MERAHATLLRMHILLAALIFGWAFGAKAFAENRAGTLDSLGLRANIIRNLGLTSLDVSVSHDNIGQLTSWFEMEANGASQLNEQLALGFD